MHIIKLIPLVLPIMTGLTACADTSPRYQDVENLAHPPKIQAEPGSPKAEGENDERLSAESANAPLGDKVYQFDSKPATLRIKLPFKKGWYAVRLALKQVEADILSFDRDEGVYVLNYKPEGRENGESGLLQGFLSGLFGSQPDAARYQVTVRPVGSETEVIVSEAQNGKKEKYIYNPDGIQESEPVAEPEVLFNRLYRALQEEVVMKPASADKL
jgi:hypothetical protein